MTCVIDTPEQTLTVTLTEYSRVQQELQHLRNEHQETVAVWHLIRARKWSALEHLCRSWNQKFKQGSKSQATKHDSMLIAPDYIGPSAENIKTPHFLDCGSYSFGWHPDSTHTQSPQLDTDLTSISARINPNSDRTGLANDLLTTDSSCIEQPVCPTVCLDPFSTSNLSHPSSDAHIKNGISSALATASQGFHSATDVRCQCLSPHFVDEDQTTGMEIPMAAKHGIPISFLNVDRPSTELMTASSTCNLTQLSDPYRIKESNSACPLLLPTMLHWQYPQICTCIPSLKGLVTQSLDRSSQDPRAGLCFVERSTSVSSPVQTQEGADELYITSTSATTASPLDTADHQLPHVRAHAAEQPVFKELPIRFTREVYDAWNEFCELPLQDRDRQVSIYTNK